MKIIFLDIEGVLNTESTYKQVNEYGIYIDEFRIAYLKQIVEQTGAKIVLCSSFRMHFKKEDGKIIANNNMGLALEKMFKKYGLKIYDITMRNSNLIREGQINVWLAKHEVENFIVIDDEPYNYKEFLRDNFIKTSIINDDEVLKNPNDCIGLSEQHIGESVKKLNKKLVKNCQ